MKQDIKFILKCSKKLFSETFYVSGNIKEKRIYYKNKGTLFRYRFLFHVPTNIVIKERLEKKRTNRKQSRINK